MTEILDNMDPVTRATMDMIARMRDDPSNGRCDSFLDLLSFCLAHPILCRPISELIKTDDMLKGMESQRLRTYCTSECMTPGRDLDEFGKMLTRGVLDNLRSDFEGRTSRHLTLLKKTNNNATKDEAKKAAADDLYKMRWGPTKSTIYNLLGQFIILNPPQREQYMAMARYLIDEAKVPVNGTDLSGTTPLSHEISTKPAFNPELAQMLYDAGGDVNHRNRYGCTVAQEITQIWTRTDQEILGRAKAAFECFLSHGGNVDIADTDGWTARRIVERGRDPGLTAALAKEDARRARKGDGCCKLCGRDDIKLMQCGKCRKSKYCQPGPARQCQKLDWPRHKKECKA